jgi:hypothetical protein
MRNRLSSGLLAVLPVVALCGCDSKTETPSPDASLAQDTLATEGEFSFFAMSLRFIKSKAPCQGSDGKTCLGGLGGDLRNGKGNGIDGADSLCAEAAQTANPGDRHLWRAFLSAGSYNGAVLNAIDRIGTGPWYSAPPKYQGKTHYASEGLLVARDKAGLLQVRPDGDATTIVYQGVNQSMGAGNAQDWPFKQCLTNEYGECTEADGDTHDTLTGSKSDGTYAGSGAATCDDWTNNTTGYGTAAFGHTWPRQLGGTDTTANWINTGEGGEACGAIINVTSTNYFGASGGGGSTPTMADGGMPSGGGGSIPTTPDGGMPPGGGGSIPTMPDGSMPPGGQGRPDDMDGGSMFPMEIPDGGPDPAMGNPMSAFDGSANGGSMGSGGMGEGTEDSIYTGGVGSGGGYGGFYCFAYITGAE